GDALHRLRCRGDLRVPVGGAAAPPGPVRPLRDGDLHRRARAHPSLRLAQGGAGVGIDITRLDAGQRLEASLGHNFVTTSVNKVIAWGRYNSMWPALFGLACCAIEMMGTGGPKFDLARFGAEVFR